MAVPSKRFVVFLCLIILHQDLVIARSHYDLQLIASPHLTSPLDSADDFAPSNQTITNNELVISPSRALGRHKRLFGLILFIVSVVVSVVATTIETIYDIHGCCGLGFSYLCSFEAEFKREQDKICERANGVDRRLQEGVKKKDALECLSKVIEIFWSEIQELVDLQQEFIAANSPYMLDSMTRKETIIQNTIRDSKQELDENDLKVFEDKLESNQMALRTSLGWTGTALSGFAVLGRHAWKSFKFHRLYKTLKSTQMEKLLKAGPKAKELIGFTGGSAKIFIKGIAKARFASKAAALSKGMKIVKYGGWFMSLLSIAMDIFSTVSILMGCDNKVDEAEKAMASLDEPKQKVTEMERKVQEYENLIKIEMEDKLIAELRKGELHSALTQVKETIKNLPGSQRTWLTQDCVEEIIPNGLETFKTSNDYTALKNDLKYVIESCVSPLKYAYECLISRSIVMQGILDKCRAGSGDFESIYDQALSKEGTRKDRCIKDGEPYTPKKDYLTSLKVVSEKEGFKTPCRLNSAAFVEDLCSRKRGGSSPQQIAENVNMDLNDVQKALDTCEEDNETKPGEIPLNEQDKHMICQYHSFGDPPEVIAEAFKDDTGKTISTNQIGSLLSSCPSE